MPTIAVAPLWSSSRFGLDDVEWRRLEARVLREVVEDLEELGFQTLDPQALRDVLERQHAWDRFVELLEFEDGLDRRFEPSPYAPPTAEVVTLRELRAEGIIAHGAILFAEVVYHSRGTCSVDARTHNRFAVVVNRRGDEIDGGGTSPCIVTHIQAKLVDTKSAATMWHNRVLRELRESDIGDRDEEQNVMRAATDLVSGTYGLAPLAPVSGRAAVAGN